MSILRKGVKIIGASNLPSSVPNHASSLYSRNLLAILEIIINDRALKLDCDDELILGCLLSNQGQILKLNVFQQGDSQ